MKINTPIRRAIQIIFAALLLILSFSCDESSSTTTETAPPETKKAITAKDILGNPSYQAISYGGYRQNTRDTQPTVEELKEDMKILHAMGIRVLRTYNVHLPHAANVLEAIHQLKKEDAAFEMYVMLGIWINCENAWTGQPNHYAEDTIANTKEVETAVEWTNQYPDIVKILAVGNEAMVKWAAAYHVQSGVILKWVNHLQDLKKADKLPKDIWITSSDNFASWGGEGAEYHKEDLTKLIEAVDFVSLHTYPMHDTHYNPDFWGITSEEEKLSDTEKIETAILRSRDYAIAQYKSVETYIKNLGIEKPIHIGETGWASASNGFYGPDGTKATDEYKEGLYHSLMREWTDKNGISCFYFEAFDENWKDGGNPGGSENHFGLFTIDGKAKYALWDLVDKGIFKGLSRGGNPIVKTHNGDKEALMKEVKLPPVKSKLVGYQ